MTSIINRMKPLALSGLALLAVGAAAPAEAGVQCRNGYQYNSAANGWIASPFCGDELIAQVARRQGMKVSGRALRQNPLLRVEACRFVGSNTRIKHLCAGDLPEDGGDSTRD